MFHAFDNAQPATSDSDPTAPPAEISEYERTRMRNIAAGNKKLYSLGLIHPPEEVVADPEHSWWSERARTRVFSRLRLRRARSRRPSREPRTTTHPPSELRTSTPSPKRASDFDANPQAPLSTNPTACTRKRPQRFAERPAPDAVAPRPAPSP